MSADTQGIGIGIPEPLPTDETWKCRRCETEHPRHDPPYYATIICDGGDFPEWAGDNYVNLLGVEGCKGCLGIIVDKVLEMLRGEERTREPYSLGADLWPGLSKLNEECGEVVQVIGKIMGIGGATTVHWDGSDLRDRLSEEMSDVLAAVCFVMEINGFDVELIKERSDFKAEQFACWRQNQRLGIEEEARCLFEWTSARGPERCRFQKGHSWFAGDLATPAHGG